MTTPDVLVSKLPQATLPLSGAEYSIINQNGVTCIVPVGYLPPAASAIVTGDINGSGLIGNLVLTLPIVNADVGTFNSLTVNGKGQVIAATLITPLLSGDVSGTGLGSIVTTITPNAVTNAKMAIAAAGTYKGNPTAATANETDTRFPPFGCCQLQLFSSTQLQLMPLNGTAITFPNGYIYNLSSSGLLSGSISGSCYLNGIASSTLSVNILYYCYLWYNNGSPVLDFSTTGHVIDATTGIVVKSGDSTRVLVGMVYTLVGPTLSDSFSARLVASWFNRQSKHTLSNFSVNRTISKSSICEVNSEIRSQFLTWGDAIDVASNQSCYGSIINSLLTSIIGLDGTLTAVSSISFTEVSTNSIQSMTSCGYRTPPEGYHYVTVGGSVSTGTGVWTSGGTLQARMTI